MTKTISGGLVTIVTMPTRAMAEHAAEGRGYAWGRQDERRVKDQAESWTFGLAWAVLNHLQVGRGPIQETYDEWHTSGCLAYTDGRGAYRRIVQRTVRSVTGVAVVGRASTLRPYTAVVLPQDVTESLPGLETAGDVVLRLTEVSGPFERDGQRVVTLTGHEIDGEGWSFSTITATVSADLALPLVIA